MKKMTVLLLVLTFSLTLFSQSSSNLPAEFSWENVCTTNGLRNYVTEPVDQNYHGPCLAFAFTAAIETTYGIENDVHGSNLFTISSPYFDYKAWAPDNHLPVLDEGFKIPLTVEDEEVNAQADVSCPVNNDDPSEDACSVERSDILEYINHPDGQRSYRLYATEVEQPQEPEWIVEDGGPLGDYVKVGHTMELFENDFGTNDDIKRYILNNGPLVLKISGYQNKNVPNANLFRDYNRPTRRLAYHAFTIIGWTSDSRWIIKDSWPDMAAITTTFPNIDIREMLYDPSDIEDELSIAQLYHVSKVSLNGRKPAQSPVVLDLNGCITQPSLELSSIEMEIDYVHIGGYLYHMFWVSSNIPVDNWVWGIAYPNGALKRSQVNNPSSSSILMSPTTSGLVTVYARAYKDGETVTVERTIYLFNGQEGNNGW